ncbi:MAG: O-antigen ligase family protein [Planctomycetes bacterium]|nr:O-antigen ligase family protein [Planctomycetota bacterium]
MSRALRLLRLLFLLLGVVCLPFHTVVLEPNVLNGDLPRLAILHLCLLLCLVTCLSRVGDAWVRFSLSPAVWLAVGILGVKCASALVAPDRWLVLFDLIAWEAALLLGGLATLDPAVRVSYRELLTGPGLWVAAGAGLVELLRAYGPDASAHSRVAPGALLDNPDFAGAYAAPMLVLAVGCFLAEASRWRLAVQGAAIVLTGGWVILLGNRGGWLSAGVGLGTLALLGVVVAVRRSATLVDRAKVAPGICEGAGTVALPVNEECDRRRPRPVRRAGVVLLLLWLSALIVSLSGPKVVSGLLDRAATASDPSTGSVRVRLEVWRAALRIWGDHPILGAGAGNFRRVYPAYRPAAERRLSGPGTRVDTAHSDPVQLLAETGPLGALGWLALVALVGWLARRAVRPDAIRTAPEAAEAYAPALVAALAASLTDGLVSHPLLFPASAAHFWMMLLALEGLVLPGTAPATSGPGEASVGRRAFLFAAAMLLLLGVFARVTRPRADGDRALSRMAQLVADLPAGPLVKRPGAPLDFSTAKTLQSVAYWTERLEKARGLDPHRYETHMLLGKVYEASGRPEDAVASYVRAGEIDPGDAQPPLAVGMALVRAGRLEHAAAEFTRAAGLDPLDARPLLNRGLCWANLSRYGEAEADLRAALVLEPGLAEAEYNLALLAALRGAPEEALLLLRAARDHGKSLSAAPRESAFQSILEMPEFRRLVEGE